MPQNRHVRLGGARRSKVRNDLPVTLPSRFFSVSLHSTPPFVHTPVHMRTYPRTSDRLPIPHTHTLVLLPPPPTPHPRTSSLNPPRTPLPSPPSCSHLAKQRRPPCVPFSVPPRTSPASSLLLPRTSLTLSFARPNRCSLRVSPPHSAALPAPAQPAREPRTTTTPKTTRYRGPTRCYPHRDPRTLGGRSVAARRGTVRTLMRT